ncbi:MAG: RNA 2',3'-cyclic phosphodiesterase, partial [Syntrophaceae bacterium]|nr:RNA 2',3'-cyclic phosphodiesterase [Syntrophaceae bacterium]
LRAFLALDHPEATGEAIARIQGRLRREIPGGMRWADPQGIHLTLKFFGDVTMDQAMRAVAALEPLAAATAPFSLALAGLGGFPDLRHPRVLWLGLTGETARLLAFHQTLEQALWKIGFPREERPFRPHLTLARLKPGGPRGLTGLDRGMTKGGQAEKPFCAPSLSLMRSTLMPQGAIYTRLQGIPLTAEEGGRKDFDATGKATTHSGEGGGYGDGSGQDKGG